MITLTCHRNLLLIAERCPFAGPAVRRATDLESVSSRSPR